MNEQWALVTHMQFAALVLCVVQYGELCGIAWSCCVIWCCSVCIVVDVMRCSAIFFLPCVQVGVARCSAVQPGVML